MPEHNSIASVMVSGHGILSLLTGRRVKPLRPAGGRHHSTSSSAAKAGRGKGEDLINKTERIHAMQWRVVLCFFYVSRVRKREEKGEREVEGFP